MTVLADRRRPATRPAQPEVDVAVLTEHLLGRYADLRRDTRALAADPEFRKVEGLSVAGHRERILEQLRALVKDHDVLRAFPTALGGSDDHGGSLARFEELVAADPSLQIKAGVQWGLFASAILHLGTADHHARLLPGAMSLDVPGAFAMTETGHGSDVAAIATTAEYDESTEEFVVHTPFRAAWKDYLGNAALHGVAAVVFAHLVTAAPGGPRVDHGVQDAAAAAPGRTHDEDAATAPVERVEAGAAQSGRHLVAAEERAGGGTGRVGGQGARRVPAWRPPLDPGQGPRRPRRRAMMAP